MPQTERVLFSWLDRVDLVAPRPAENQGPGPVYRAVAGREYDRVVLLSAPPYQESAEVYLEWLREQEGLGEPVFATPFSRLLEDGKVHRFFDWPVHHHDLSDRDPERVFEATIATVQAVKQLVAEEGVTATPEWTFYMSPGTPTMAAAWFLISEVEGAGLLQSDRYKGLIDCGFPHAAWRSRLEEAERDSIRTLAAVGVRPPEEEAEQLGEIWFSGSNRALQELKTMVEQVAPIDVSVLILGETGTGKELLAQEIHRASGRAGDFKAINCGAIPASLIESELFGHEKGAFFGADEARPGKIGQADGGTLFLDEIGELPLAGQVKLLRVLQEGVIEPVGPGARAREVDVRIVAATHQDLRGQVERGEFREDLLYRLNAWPLVLPPLRERIGDVPVIVERLCERFLASMASGTGRRVRRIRFDDGALAVLARRRWSGNVRELDNVVQRAIVIASRRRENLVELVVVTRDVERAIELDRVVAPTSAPAPRGKAGKAAAGDDGPPFSLRGFLKDLRDEIVATACRERSQADAARLLGESRQWVHNVLKSAGDDP